MSLTSHLGYLNVFPIKRSHRVASCSDNGQPANVGPPQRPPALVPLAENRLLGFKQIEPNGQKKERRKDVGTRFFLFFLFLAKGKRLPWFLWALFSWATSLSAYSPPGTGSMGAAPRPGNRAQARQEQGGHQDHTVHFPFRPHPPAVASKGQRAGCLSFTEV